MQQGTTYNRQAAFALLLIGMPKSGKTALALSFPKPYFLDLDKNLAGALRYHGDDFDPSTLYFDDLSTPEGKPPHKLNKLWGESCKALDTAIASPDVETIIVDGLTILADYLQKYILSSTSRDSSKGKLIIAGEECMQMNHWTPFQSLIKQLIMECRASGKKLIFICHEDQLTDKDGTLLGYYPLIPGSLKKNIAGLFTDVWRCQAGTKARKPYHNVRFAPKNMMQVGNSLSIKDEEFDTTGKTCTEIWNYLGKHF